MRSVSCYSTLRQEDAQVKVSWAGARPLEDRSRSGAAFAISGLTTPTLTTDSALSDPDSDCSKSASSLHDYCGTTDVDYARSSDSRARYGSSGLNALSKPHFTSLASHPLLLPPKAKSREGFVENDICEKTGGSKHGHLKDWNPKPASSECEFLRPHDPMNAVRPAEDTLPPSTISIPLNTTCLISKTHKLTNGNMTVLPSRSLLVDFREGERRKGRKGNQVLVISSDGQTVRHMLGFAALERADP